MKKDAWEKLCSGCGLCCHEKVITENLLLIDTSSACEFYDSESRLCTVYDRRFEKCPRCLKMTLFRAMFADYLPPTCGYVRWARAHHIRFCREKECVLENGIFSFVDDSSH